ncbi:TPA: hypothetical protein ACM4E9_004420 [Escherichia coli]
MRIRLCFILMIMLVMSGTLQATTIMGDVKMGINMEITDVICTTNNGKGISKHIVMPVMSRYDLTKNAVQSTNLPLLLDCSSGASLPSSISLRLDPAAGVILVGDGSNGILKTDLTGIGKALTWESIAGHPPWP